MKTTKRILSLLLTLVMVLSTVAFTPVLAAGDGGLSDPAPFNFAQAFAEEKTVTATLTPVFEASRAEILSVNPMQGYDFTAVEGVATNGTYAYIYLMTKGFPTDVAESTERGRIMVVSLADWEIKAISGFLDLDHGNDIAYNPQTGKLVVSHNYGNKVSIVNPANLGAIESTKVLDYFSFAVSYVENQYLLLGEKIVYAGADFAQTKTANREGSAYISQGMDADSEYIYIPKSPDAKKGHTKNLIHIHSTKTGEFLGEVFVDTAMEVESMFHVDDKHYILFNNNGAKIYEITFATEPDPEPEINDDFNWPDAEGWEVSQVIYLNEYVALRARMQYEVDGANFRAKKIAYDFATCYANPAEAPCVASFGTAIPSQVSYCKCGSGSGLVGTHFSGKTGYNDANYFATVGGKLTATPYKNTDLIQTLVYDVTGNSTGNLMSMVFGTDNVVTPSSGIEKGKNIALRHNSIGFVSSEGVEFRLPLVVKGFFNSNKTAITDIQLWIQTRDSMNCQIDGQGHNDHNGQNSAFNGKTEGKLHLVTIGSAQSGYGTTSSAWTYTENIWNEAEFNGTKYHTVAAALAAAGNSGTVKLISDAREVDVLVPLGVTLDLNGYTLTADSVTVFGHLVDRTEGQGALEGKIASINNANSYLPLYDGEAYRFFQYEFVEGAPKDVEDGKKYRVALRFDNVEAYNLIATSNTTELNVCFKLTIGEQSYNIRYSDAGLKEWAIHAYNYYRDPAFTMDVLMTLTLNGISKLGGAEFNVVASVTGADPVVEN